VTKDKESYPFGQIYAGFRYGFKDTYKPQPTFLAKPMKMTAEKYVAP